MTVGSRAFAYCDELMKKWAIPAGDYGIRVGSSSRIIQLGEIITLE